MRVLGIETSCDETGIAIYDTTSGLLANELFSQIDLHALYGGVVPELASRDHLRRLPSLLEAALSKINHDWKSIDCIAYTQGPGLAGALLTGCSFAEALGMAHNIPTLGIHHLEGHLLSPLLEAPSTTFPFIALLVSGGHSQIMRVDRIGDYVILGETRDDAAGEAFDKTAKLLGLPYPGGPQLAKIAAQGKPSKLSLPRPMLHSKDYDFSFSGLKTAVLTTLQQNPDISHADLAYEFQEAITDVLAEKTFKAMREHEITTLIVAGGVGANLRLREKLNHFAKKRRATVLYPDLKLCTDNGAMIAFAAAMKLQNGASSDTARKINAQPRWSLTGRD